MSSDDTPRSVDPALRVVSIAHSAFIDGSGRLRYDTIANDPGVHLTLVIPDRWVEFGRPLQQGKSRTQIELKRMKVAFQAVPKANWYLHFYPHMARMLDELSPDVLHLWEEPWSLVASQAAYLCRRRGVSLVLETEQNILRDLPFPFQQLRRYTLERTDMLVARQKEALDVSRACGYTGPATFVEYVVDQECFRQIDRRLAKQMFNVCDFTIGYVGRLVREKGLFTVLDAIKACRKKVNFLMMGSGTASCELRRRIQEFRLEDRVQILDPQPPGRVAIFMNSLSALVLMSETTRTWKEQFGRVIIEAQACGVPVIGSSSGSIPAVIGKGGWIVEEANSQELAELLDDLASNPSKLAETSIKTTENLGRFSSEVMSGSLRNAWLGAVASKNVSRRFQPSSVSLARLQKK